MNHILSDLLSKAAKNNPNQIIKSDIKGCRNISYLNFEQRITDLSKGFLLRSITPKSKVLLFLSDERASIESFLALTKIGATIFTTTETKQLNQIIVEHRIETTILPLKATVEFFKPEFLSKQNREHLNISNFPYLKTLVLLDQIKLRGAFNLQELILIGKHIDDTEIEDITLTPSTENYSIYKTEFKNKKLKAINLAIDEICLKNFPFFDLKKL